MKKNYSSSIIDNLVLIFSVFFISFLWIRYYEHNTFLVLLFSSLITFFICAFLHFILKKRQKNQKIKQKEAIFIEKISNFLIFSTKQQILSVFEKCIKSKKVETKRVGDYIIFNDILLRPIYSRQTVLDSDVIESILKAKSKKLTEKNLIICGVGFSAEAKEVAKKCSQINITLLDQKQTYFTFFKSTNFCLNDENEKKKLPLKTKLKNLSLIAFNKQRFKSYLFSALVLFVGSYFMRYNLYYLISSTVLILLAFFSYFNKPFNKPEKDIFETKKE